MAISEFNIADVIIQSSLNEDFTTFGLLLSRGDFSFKEAFEMQIDVALDQRVSYLPASHQTQELMQELFSKEFSSLAIQALTSVARKYFEDYVRKNPEDASVKEYMLLDQPSRANPEYVSRVCQLLYSKGIFKDALPTHEFIFENPQILQYLQNKEFLLQLLFSHPQYFPHISSSFKNDKSFVLAALSRFDSYCFEYMNLSLLGPSLKRDKELIAAFLAKDGANLEHTAPSFQDDLELVSIALQSNDSSFRFASAALRSNELFILSKLEKHPAIYPYISEKLKHDPEFNLKAAKINGTILRFAPLEIKDNTLIALAAVSSKGESLAFVTQRCRNCDEIVLEAIYQNPRALGFAPKKFKTDKLLAMALLKKDGLAYMLLDKSLQQDEEIVIAAVNQNGFILISLDEEKKNNKHLVMLALKTDHSVYRSLSSQLKADPEICLAALSRNGIVYEYLPEHLQADVSFLSQALLKNPSLFTQIAHSAISEDVKKDIYQMALDLFIHDLPDLKPLSLQILEYKNPDIQDYIVSLFLKTPKDQLLSLFATYNCPLHQEDFFFLLLILNSLEISKDEKLVLLNSIKNRYKFLVKDFMKRQMLLKTFLCLEAVSLASKYQLLHGLLCQDDKANLINCLHLLSSIAQINPELLTTISTTHLKAEDLADLLIQDFKTHGLLPAGGLTSMEIAQSFLKLRNPGAFFTYISSFKKDPAMRGSLIRFIAGLLHETFFSDRHKANAHRQYLNQAQLTAWETPLTSIKTAVDTEDPDDLLLCGTEVTGSCQRVDGDLSLTKTLMGYVLDGKIRIMAIKNRKSQILARGILKIVLTNENNPALFLEKIYGPLSYAPALQDLARKKAQALGVPIFVDGVQSTLFSAGNIAPFEYEDALSAVTNGKYQILADPL